MMLPEVPPSAARSKAEVRTFYRLRDDLDRSWTVLHSLGLERPAAAAAIGRGAFLDGYPVHSITCRNRHCPKCQAQARQRWIAAREKELLDLPYFHVVFTIPHELNALCLRNAQVLYDLLFRASSAAMLEVAANPKRLDDPLRPSYNEEVPGETPVEEQEQKTNAYAAVLKSRTFARSDQLQSFLRHICELELAGRGEAITEYSIATEALNRRADYTPGADSSVRSRAHTLRHKLQEYYETEAPDAVWRIELPKGSYRPLFVKAAAAEAPSAPAIEQMEKASVSQLRPFLFGFVAAATLAAMAWGVLLWRERVNAMDPVLQQAWGPALAHSSDVLIVAGCPPVGRFISIAPGLVPKVSTSVQTPTETEKWYRAQNLENRGGPLYMFPSRGYTVFSDVLAISKITALLTQAGVTFQTVPEPRAQPMAVHERALVLVGAPAYAPFVARLLKMTPFSIHYDPALNDEVISDGPPDKAPTAFVAKRNSFANRFSTVYGLITVLPSQPGRDRPERTIIFSGITGSPGAQAAVQYFSSPVALRDLQERFRRQGHAQFPPAYQVVVRCGVDAEVAINAVYETHRIMSQPPVVE